MNRATKQQALALVLLAATVCTAAFPGPSRAEVDIYRQVDTAKQCSICHYRWIQTFYVDHRATPIAPLEEEKVVATKEMCFSCHDGSVRDSRDRICNDPGHQLGVVPSDLIKIPKNFPLDKNGGLLCATCHTPHATQGPDGRMVEFFLRSSNVNSSFCKTCHISKFGDTGVANHPVDVLPAGDAAAILQAGGRLGTSPPNRIICETCHIPHGGINNKFLVLSVEDPKTRSVLCEVCHTKTPGLTSNPDWKKHSHPLDLTPGIRSKIPKKWSNGHDVVLGTGGELVCRTCHQPHGAPDSTALLADHNNRDSLCMQCHKDKSGITLSKHYLNTFESNETTILGLPVKEAGPCSACHLAHQGSGDLMWARRSPLKGRPGQRCLDCHRPGGTAEKLLPADFTHPMDIPLSKGMTLTSLPLYEDDEVAPDGVILCGTCHDFHNATPAYEKPEDNGSHTTAFLRHSGEGASTICTLCHRDQALVEGTDHDLRITAPDYKNSSGQSPAKGGLCSTCHRAHSETSSKYLWSGPVGPTTYKGWNPEYAAENDVMISLCTGCHGPGQCAQDKIPTFGLHPRGFLVNKPAILGMTPHLSTELLQTTYPIYSESGDRDVQGAIVCSTCHNPHQWNASTRARGPGERSEGTVSTSFLRPDLLKAFCTECHDKDIFIKYNYFHKKTGRSKKRAFNTSKQR